MHRFLILTVLFVGGCGKSIENTAETSAVTSSRSNAESQHLVDTIAATPESVVGTYRWNDQDYGGASNLTWVFKPGGTFIVTDEEGGAYKKRWSISDAGEVVADGDKYKLTSSGDLIRRDRIWGMIELKRVNDINSPSEITKPSKP